MRVLVTGGAGYIGSHAALSLREHGYEPIILDNLVTGHRELVGDFPFVLGDIGNYATLRTVLRDVEAVIHFAAHAYVGESVQNPRKYFENNVRDALTLLGAAIDSGVKFFVFSSTCAVYGVPELSPISEDFPKNPINPYGATKLFFENSLREYGRVYGIRHLSLRYFNAAGADSKGRTGELHHPETHLIPSALEVAAGKRPFLEVYGENYPTGDGTCVRDYIHVSDLADAHVAALDLLMREVPIIHALNLGTGTGHSINQVIAKVEEVTRRTVKKVVRPRRPGDPPELVADPLLANKVLNWRPRQTLHDMVSNAWTWSQRRSMRDDSKDHLLHVC